MRFASAVHFRRAYAITWRSLWVGLLFVISCGDGSTDPGTQTAASVELSDTVLSFTSLGDTTQLAARVKDAAGAVMAGAPVTWATPNSSFATVSSTGLVTSLATGTATITATSGSARATATVTVSQAAASVTLSPTSLSFVSVGDTATFVPIVKDARGSKIWGATVTWEISDTSDTAFATVSSTGLVTSVATGTATITATSGAASTTATTTVSQVASSVTLSPTSLSFTSVGDTATFVPTVKDAGGTAISGATVTWATVHPSVATVSSAGLVTAIADGTAMITATSGSASRTATAAVTCSVDTDSDRLYDCVETNTGTYVSTSDTGTDPNDSDSDDDAISDGDEVLGTLGGLDLPSLGASPVIPTILIEHDWFDDGGHSHKPTVTQLDMVTASFAAQGVQIIHDYGQGAPFDGGNFISDADGDVDGFGTDYYAYKLANFDANRSGYFHYNLFPHQYNGGSSSGLAEINGDDLITATHTFYTNDLAVAGTIQHELGHNLNLRHGGNVNTNRKPNYNSVMSYNYQFYGVDDDCTPQENGVLDYSHGVNPPLDEENLNETLGICGGAPGWDWNQDGDALDVGLIADINRDWNPLPSPPVVGDGDLEILFDYDDWSNLSYTGITDFDGAVAGSREAELAICQAFPDNLFGTN